MHNALHGDVQANKRHRPWCGKYLICGVWIAVDIRFCHGCHVTGMRIAPQGPSHNHDFFDQLGNGGMLLQCDCQVCQPTDSNDGDFVWMF